MKQMNDVKTDLLMEEKKFYDLKNQSKLNEIGNDNPEELKQLQNAITLSKPLLVKAHPF